MRGGLWSNFVRYCSSLKYTAGRPCVPDGHDSPWQRSSLAQLPEKQNITFEWPCFSTSIQGLESLIQINCNGTCLTCWASEIGLKEADLSRGLSLQSVRLEPRELCWPDLWEMFGAEPLSSGAGLPRRSLVTFCVLLLGVKVHLWSSMRSRWT